MARTTSSHIVDVLNAEWQDLVNGERGTVTAWARRHPALAGCGDLASVIAAVPGRPDAVLHALLSEAARGDRLAARTVLQTMLGKVVVMARRDRQAGIDDYVSALWCRISSYPLERRPQRIAANLALDTLKDVVRERGASARATVTPWPPERFLGTLPGGDLWLGPTSTERHVADLTADDVVDAAGRLGLIDADTGAVLLSVYRDGLSSRCAAARHRTSPDMVRYRCSRAVRKLAGHAAELAEVA